MSQPEIGPFDSSSDWQSCSDSFTSTSTSTSSSPASLLLFDELSDQALAIRTLNFSVVDPPAHEPSLFSGVVGVVCPLSLPLATASINSRPKSQLASSTSTSFEQRSDIKPSSPYTSEPQTGTSSAFVARDATRSVFLLPPPTYHVASLRYPANFAGMDTVNVPELVERLGSEEDAVRKMAVFKLQSNIGDPSFAEIFIQDGGMQKLKFLTMHATGNTLAYSLTSFSRLLEVDKGWDYVEQDLIERARTRHAQCMTSYN
jgi:hypothetical protein